MKKRNFLLGKGERLTEQVRVPSGPVDKVPPYTFAQAKNRLEPMLKTAVAELNQLPDAACPNDRAVAKLTLNPEYIAKTYYPTDLLRAVGLETVGSRARIIKPEQKSRDRVPEDAVTTELFLMGTRTAFRRWAEEFPNWTEGTDGAKQIVGIEKFSVPSPAEKIKHIRDDAEKIVYEIVLHVDEQQAENFYLPKFRAYLEGLELQPKFDHRFYAGGLCFLELEAPVESAEQIAAFSLVRVVREMPSLRMLRPTIRAMGMAGISVKLPEEDAIDPSIRAAIFDGGIPANHPITKWATPIEIPGVGPAEDELLDHGVGVTSAFLFGHIDPKQPLTRPYSKVDHYRVLDNVPGQNPFELYEVLEKINNILKTKDYDFINLSLGPRLPVDDDEIHAWTAVLDEYLSKGTTLAVIAVGNDGEGDPAMGANRVQVPADCVNALGIGACDVPDENWQRAPYSSVGPGRSPGLIKPDLVDFGGSVQRPFLVLDTAQLGQLRPTGGTSFAAPSTLRMGTGVRAHFGSSLNALAIRTLLVHCSEGADIPTNEIGWGRLARALDDIVVCDDHVMRVVFQGRITASKYIRAPIPLPSGPLTGMVNIKATLCYATDVDPHHPANYTRSGLEPVFRPNKTVRRDPDSLHPTSESFFGKTQKGQTEQELRRDAWKWENCQHAELRFQGGRLNEPVFDIHYNARMESRNDTRPQEIQYALVITVKAPKVTDLYDQVVRRYATQLEPLLPVIDIPVRV